MLLMRIINLSGIRNVPELYLQDNIRRITGYMTIKEIADKLGVSSTTVSNVIRGKDKQVSPAMKERVQAALKEFNYTPNIGAVNLARKRSRIIGVICYQMINSDNGLQDPFAAALIRSIEETIRQAGYYMMLYVSDSISEIMYWLTGWNMEGLIVLGSNSDSRRELQETFHKPVVFIDSYLSPDEKGHYNVGLDDRGGAYSMTKYLLEQGHRKILFVADNLISVDAARYHAFCSAMKDSGIDADKEHNLFLLDPHPDKIQESMDQLYKKVSSYTAVFCASDYYAIKLIGTFQDQGVQVPEDISVTGFDDIYIAELCRPKLTTVHQDVSLKGRTAVRMLTEILEGRYHSGHEVLLPTRLIIRDSVKGLNHMHTKSGQS